MGKWDGLDRRKFPRVNYPCLVVINGVGGTQDALLTHTENVGIGGVGVILKQNLEMFSPIELEIDLLDLGDHIKCKGKVVWNVQRRIESKSKPLFYDIGIEFDELSEPDHKRLQAIIKKLVEHNM